jgi:hypothetical protein
LANIKSIENFQKGGQNIENQYIEDSKESRKKNRNVESKVALKSSASIND